jgi:hypothetical protein
MPSEIGATLHVLAIRTQLRKLRQPLFLMLDPSVAPIVLLCDELTALFTIFTVEVCC